MDRDWAATNDLSCVSTTLNLTPFNSADKPRLAGLQWNSTTSGFREPLFRSECSTLDSRYVWLDSGRTVDLAGYKTNKPLVIRPRSRVHGFAPDKFKPRRHYDGVRAARRGIAVRT